MRRDVDLSVPPVRPSLLRFIYVRRKGPTRRPSRSFLYIVGQGLPFRSFFLVVFCVGFWVVAFVLSSLERSWLQQLPNLPQASEHSRNLSRSRILSDPLALSV